MRRGKPLQQLYKPGSGPLRKSNNGVDEQTSFEVSGSNNLANNDLSTRNLRHSSERNSTRDSVSAQRGDSNSDRDTSRRQKKPEQIFYVPRPVAQAKESNTVQDLNKNMYPYSNEKTSDSGNGGRYKSRGMNNDGGPPNNWGRTRDSWSVEPSGPSGGYSRGEKMQTKPPSVPRRHSTVGLEGNHIPFNLDKLPPRLRKKYLEENNITVDPTVREDNWDGSSMSFQGHGGLRNPSFHQYGGSSGGYQAAGYHTLPNKPSRGRGRYTQGRHQQQLDQQQYRCSTPDSVRSPAGSRPHTPPPASRRGEGAGSRPQTPVRSGWDDQGAGWYEAGHGGGGGAREGRWEDSRDYGRGVKGGGRSAGGGGSRNSRYNRSHEGRDRNTPIRETPFREPPIRETPLRETPSREHPVRETPGRDSPSSDLRRGRDSSGRKDRHSKRSYSDKRRNRRNKERSRSREHTDKNYGENYEDSRFRDRDRDTSEFSRRQDNDASNFNKKSSDNGAAMASNVEEDQVAKLETEMTSVTLEEKPLASVQLVQRAVATTLDWSEEVELALCDRLEVDNFSDALPRSDSLSSLQEEISTMSLPPNIGATTAISTHKHPKRRSGRRSRNGSRNRSRQNSTTSVDSRDGGGWSRRRGSRDRREGCGPGFWATDSSRGPSRDASKERLTENWRDECVIKRSDMGKNKNNLEEIKNVDASSKKAGVIVIPHSKEEPVRPVPSMNTHDHPRYPETRRTPVQQKALFDPNHPEKPIIVKSSSPRVAAPGFTDNNVDGTPPVHTTDQFGNLRPPWYEETNQLRQFLKEALEYLLSKAIKFCESENVEQHFWNILYHNIIELMRKAIKNDPDNKDKYKTFLLYLIDEGSRYYERLLKLLEESYTFKLSDFLDENSATSHKGLGLVSLALVCAQKLYLFLGDLGRYKEEVNESANYGKCRQWYIKSHEINPKNGKPYNQLALLAVHARRKLDAVYYYMRSLMSSNPVPSARESLISLLDENRKKKHNMFSFIRAVRAERKEAQGGTPRTAQTASATGQGTGRAGRMRGRRGRPWWFQFATQGDLGASGRGPRVHRTTRASEHEENDDEEDLAALSSVEVNKRFVISYLHVHGKLITKIGMESFQETSMQMLREFRALLQHSPVPLPCNRFLQLLALNMFAIESTQLKVSSKFKKYQLFMKEIMGNILFCETCPEVSNPESEINLSDDCVQKLVTGDKNKKITKEQAELTLSEDGWMKKLKCLDDIHTNENGLTMQAVETLIAQVESRIGAVRPNVCSSEQLITCLQKHEGCIIRCKHAMEDFIDCVDKTRIQVIIEKTKQEDEKNFAKRQDENDAANDFLRNPQLQSQPGYRSEVQERALVVSLQMFSLILERCVAILREHLARPAAVAADGDSAPSTPPHSLPPDVDVLLPAVKVWCDWLLGHAAIWNPPPNTQDYRVGSPGDAWSRLANLMNLLEMIDQSTSGRFVKDQQEGYVRIRLPEDAVLRGFTPLAYAAAREPTFAPSVLDAETSRAALRVERLLFFGTVYLCGVEPPVLRLEIEDGGRREYVSTVDEDGESRRRSRGEEDDEDEEETVTDCNNDVLLESISGEEDTAEEEVAITPNTSNEVRDLLTRKVELEKRKRNQELHMQRVKKILSQSVVSVHMEIWPKYLVPDTNCFIDHLEGIKVIAQAHCYTLMVPIIVLNELEGLSRGNRPSTTPTDTGGSVVSGGRRQSPDPQHVLKVAQSAKEALDFLKTRHSTVKCITTKGAVLPSTAFYTEDDGQWTADFRNDDKILTTCLLLGKNRQEVQSAQEASTSGGSQPSSTPSEPRRLYREVVLLTEDRNLRVKAHARDVPVRELPDFMRWAGLGGPAG
nr:unnamed protein product [Callosobruchus chinensis]